MSLLRQQRPQPSHRLSHSARVISAMVLVRQNGLSSGIEASFASRLLTLPPPSGGGRIAKRSGWGVSRESLATLSYLLPNPPPTRGEGDAEPPPFPLISRSPRAVLSPRNPSPALAGRRPIG